VHGFAPECIGIQDENLREDQLHIESIHDYFGRNFYGGHDFNDLYEYLLKAFLEPHQRNL
jgi:hypothetical protein